MLAIGSPYQLSHSVSLGIISALGRKNLGFSEYEDFIQTDAAINRGNSGGALVNARGELIGINTGIFSSNQNGGSEGIGFAIPSNLARRVIGEIIEHGVVRRGSLGRMILYPLTTQVAAQLGVRDTTGAFVNEIDRRSPAYQAGLEPATSSCRSTARPSSIPATSSGSSPTPASAAPQRSSSFATGGSDAQDSRPPARGITRKIGEVHDSAWRGGCVALRQDSRCSRGDDRIHQRQSDFDGS